ncbi:MAG: fructose-bisphosphate aldolase, partial [Thermoproteota archaeon]
FRRVVESCPIPLVILGGPKVESDEKLLAMIKEAIEAGASGVAFGRNIWQRKNPEAMVRLLADIIHGRKSQSPS